MADSKSDYKKNNFNLNDFLPSKMKGDFLESLNSNLFNRYLTKDEFDHIVGVIGDPDPNETVNTQIKEPTVFRQNNQLQPVISKKIGSENHFMSFEDFMVRIGRTGVDTEQFDQWGATTQFNWVPPIDMDKIINYRDYYWNSNINGNNKPEYITIKNQINWSEARYNQSVKSIRDVTNPIKIQSNTNTVISISGNNVDKLQVGDHLILNVSNGNTFVLSINSINYNISSTNTDITFNEDYEIPVGFTDNTLHLIDIPVLNVVNGIATVEGDFTKLLVEDYIISVNSSIPQAVGVKKSEFNEVTNRTTIEFKDELDSYTKISLFPLLSLMKAEVDIAKDINSSIVKEEWNSDKLGQILWYRNILISEGNTGYTVFGSNYFSDASASFITDGVENGDYLLITKGKDSGKHFSTITSQTSVSIPNRFFTASNLEYKIIRDFSVNDLISEESPDSPSLYQMWINSSDGSMNQFDGTDWSIVYKGFMVLLDSVSNRMVTRYSNNNDWSKNNYWTHKSQISEYTGMIRGQIPIIEYFPYLELSETSYSEKIWKYRRNSNVSYIESTIPPKFIELLNIEFSGNEFEFIDPYTIQFNDRFGNFGEELEKGFELRLAGFNSNDGIYAIEETLYTEVISGERFVTTIKLQRPLIDINDIPLESKILPLKTAVGDNYVSHGTSHWEYNGVRFINASSLEPVRNPMLDVEIDRYVVNGFESIVGLSFQSFSIVGNDEIIEPAFIFDTRLQDLVLIDDYQEGDIRVYINGVRRYGIFEDIQSHYDDNYVGGIQLINGITIKPSDIIRIELGEYDRKEIGLRSVLVKTPIGDELVNLVNNRKIEQQKSEVNQYPFFTLRDIYGTRIPLSNSIFKYKEDSSYPVNPYVMKRIVGSSNDYAFVHELSDAKTGRLYCYYDYRNVGFELQSIWKLGSNNEMYAPVKVDNQWEMPNQWYYNIDHKNYNEINLSQIYRHFKSIIDQQTQPGMFSRNGGLFFLDDEINYGLGGTIKEHNESFDTLVSSIFVNNGNPPRVIAFAKNQYKSQTNYLKDQFYSNISSLVANTSINNVAEMEDFISESIIDIFENNGKYDQWFGDTTSYDNGIGVKNWIASTVQFGITEPVKPHLIVDTKLALYKVVGHDGRYIDVSFSPAQREQLLRRVTASNETINQIVADSNIQFPQNNNGNPLTKGLLLLRTDTNTKTRKLYRVNANFQWELIDINSWFASTILEVENRLYAVATNRPYSPRYDFSYVESHNNFNELMERQFNQYVIDEQLELPLVNSDRFQQNNPFTWNYSYTPIPHDPVTNGINTNVAGTWQQLYKNIFGTSYPHLEPWKLQGYDDSPEWWDTVYKAVDGRRWTANMWSNILSGIIPQGRKTPSGDVSDGSIGTIEKIFNYVPVNIDSVSTLDGYAPDDLLPPYWNTINTTNPAVRGLYDPNEAEFVVTPQLDYEFGKNGLVEWEWKTSGSYNYDKMIVAYKIDPMKFMHSVYGIDFYLVSCLQVSKETEKVFSHNDVIFHGDYVESNNSTYKSYGMNQWYVHYNRYAGYDGITSEFRSMWKDWTPDLSYLVGAFIDTSGFRINNNLFDITSKDFDIAVKKTKGISDKWLQSLTATITDIPNRYSKLKDRGIGWTAVFNNVSPINTPMEYYGVQNYSVNMNRNDNTLRLYSYPIRSIDYVPSNGFQNVIFDTPLTLSDLTGLDSNVTYSSTIVFDGLNGNDGTQIEFDVINCVTIEDLIDAVNDAISSSGTISLNNGNLTISSNNHTNKSSVDIQSGSVFEFINGFDKVDEHYIEQNLFNRCFRIDGNFVSVFDDQKYISIVDDSIFDGKYTIDRVFYDSNTTQTLIYIKEFVTIPPLGAIVPAGNIEPFNAKTLPDEWVTGTVIYFNTTGYLPNNIDDEIPYYIIRLDDRTFKIAETELAAKQGFSYKINGSAVGEVYVGHIDMTFTALNGNRTNYTWRTHTADRRYVNKSNNLSISGIQLMVDFLTGYSVYTSDQGFVFKNPNGNNYDRFTGMNNNWHTEIEKYVDWLFALRNYNQETMLSYQVRENIANDTIDITSGVLPNWSNGTAIVILPDGNNPLPATFNSPFASSIPYYVIKIEDNNTGFKVALTKSDAMKGNAIDLVDSGTSTFRVQLYKELTVRPVYELNPFKHYVWVKHDQGILANVLDEDYTDPTSASRLYNNFLIELDAEDALVLRKDRESRISLTEDWISWNLNREENGSITRHISGMHLFFDGYEHIIRFNDYSVSNSLIYDSFFGLATPRFFVEFDRQQEFTLRPNVGGLVIQNDSLVQNFESITNDMRYFYDAANATEGRPATELARTSLGYDGTKDYMDDLKINPKTQFMFWQGLIQNKGTNNSVNAFVNQSKFDSASVDEFWAYKIGSFGDIAEKNHIEMKMIPNDAIKNELRLEFVAPENVAPDRSFNSIDLTDMSRWWNQPDQLEAMLPNKAFFFDAKVIKIVDNFEDYNVLKEINNKLYYVSDTLMPDVIVSYLDTNTQTMTTMVKGIEYKIINQNVIEFIRDPRTLEKSTLSVMSYDYDVHNPAVVIDKKKGVVTHKLPIWNPARRQYHAPAYSIVDLHTDIDPAIYNVTLDSSNTGTALWKGNHANVVWFDSSREEYIPYQDSKVIPNLNERISKWGNLMPWGDITLYQWTESLLSPEEYEKQAEFDAKNIRLSNDEKVTGIPYKILYQNIKYDDPNDVDAEPVWQQVKSFNLSFIAGLTKDTVDTQLAGKTVSLYINGEYKEDITFENAEAVNSYFGLMYFGDYCNTIIPLPIPTDQELKDKKYRYFTPHTIEKRFEKDAGEIYNVYYYWVTSKKNSIKLANSSTTLYGAERDLKTMTSPFMIIDGFRTPDFGYGLIFGNIFDEFGYNLPFRYTQAIIKGLQGTVKEEDRYVMRFTRDFTLRDNLETGRVTPKNKHNEWKLFREKQFQKVDRYLWNKMTEALVGYQFTTDGKNINYTKPIPSLNRILFDRLYLADTQYGLGDEQVMTDKTLSLQTVMSILTDPKITYEYVNIFEFLENHLFETPEDIFESMKYIYENFTVEEVNRIFFAVLHDAFSLKKEYAEFLKTSWVALQISENVTESSNVQYDTLRLVNGPGCNPIPPPPPTPTPTIPNDCGSGEFDRILQDGRGRLSEDGECRIIEPPYDAPECGDGEYDRIDEDGESRVTEDGECRIIEF